jgi:hypothetical protein
MEWLQVVTQALTVIWANLDSLILAVNGLLAVLVVIFLAIPGDQPEKAIDAFKNWLSKFSRK